MGGPGTGHPERCGQPGTAGCATVEPVENSRRRPHLRPHRTIRLPVSVRPAFPTPSTAPTSITSSFKFSEQKQWEEASTHEDRLLSRMTLPQPFADRRSRRVAAIDRPDPLGRPAAGPEAALSSWPPPTWSSRCGSRSRRTGGGAWSGGAARPAPARHRAGPARLRRSRSSSRRAPVLCAWPCGPSEYSLHAQGAEDFPAPARAVGAPFSVERQAFVGHRQPRRPGGLAGRVAAGADRDPGRVRRRAR